MVVIRFFVGFFVMGLLLVVGVCLRGRAVYQNLLMVFN